jgi:hypothetical protein
VFFCILTVTWISYDFPVKPHLKTRVTHQFIGMDLIVEKVGILNTRSNECCILWATKNGHLKNRRIL